MPVVLKNARIGDVVRPPKNAMYASGFIVRWERSYVVVRKDPKTKSVWLNKVPQEVEYRDDAGTKRTRILGDTLSPTGERMGIYQGFEDDVWLLPSDPQPSDTTRWIAASEVAAQDIPKKRGGPDSKYEFAFDDDDVSLDDLPAQAQILADILLETYRADGQNSWSEKQIEAILSRKENVARLHTKQPPIAIFRFYRPDYARKGFLNRKN